MRPSGVRLVAALPLARRAAWRGGPVANRSTGRATAIATKNPAPFLPLPTPRVPQGWRDIPASPASYARHQRSATRSCASAAIIWLIACTSCVTSVAVIVSSLGVPHWIARWTRKDRQTDRAEQAQATERAATRGDAAHRKQAAFPVLRGLPKRPSTLSSSPAGQQSGGNGRLPVATVRRILTKF